MKYQKDHVNATLSFNNIIKSYDLQSYWTCTINIFRFHYGLFFYRTSLWTNSRDRTLIHTYWVKQQYMWVGCGQWFQLKCLRALRERVCACVWMHVRVYMQMYSKYILLLPCESITTISAWVSSRVCVCSYIMHLRLLQPSSLKHTSLIHKTSIMYHP